MMNQTRPALSFTRCRKERRILPFFTSSTWDYGYSLPRLPIRDIIIQYGYTFPYLEISSFLQRSPLRARLYLFSLNHQISEVIIHKNAEPGRNESLFSDGIE